MSTKVSFLQDLPSYTEAMAVFQEKIRQAHQDAFAPYKDCFKGKKVVLVGDGATTRIFEGMKDAIYIGVNNVLRLPNIKLDYYFTSDCFDNVLLNNENKLVEKSFYALNILTMVHYIPDNSITAPAKKVYYSTTPPDDDYNFPKDITDGLIIVPPSIIFLAAAFALYGNPKQLFLVGCDCGDFRKTNINLEYKKLSSAHAAMASEWKFVKEFAARHKPDTEIISINPCNLEGLFKDEIRDMDAWKALKYRDNDNYEKALSHALEALKTRPDHPGLLSLAADIMEKTGDKKMFETSVKKWLEKNPEWIDGYKMMSSHFRDAGNEKEAIRWARLAYDKYSDKLASRLWLAHILRFYHRDSELESLIREIDSVAFNAAFGNSIYADVLRSMYPYKKRIEQCLEAKKYFPNDMDLFFHMENAYSSGGDLSASENIIQEALNVFPDYQVAAYHRLINITLTRDDLSKAVGYARKLWEFGAWWMCSWMQICEILLRLNRNNEALSLLEEIARISPNMPGLYRYYAKIYVAQNLIQKAMECLVIEVNRMSFRRGTSFAAIDFLSSLFMNNGQWNEAHDLLFRALENNFELHERWLTIANFFYQYGDYTKAFIFVRKALEMAPDSIVNRLFLTKLLQKQKNFDEAIEIMKEQLVSFPNWSAGWMRLAELIEARRGDKWQDESIECAARAVEVDPQNLRSILFYLNRLKKASKSLAAIECNKILLNNPHWANGYMFLYHISTEWKDYDDALRFARIAQGLDPDDHDVLTAVTTALMNKKEFDLAQEECSTFLKKHPKDGIACRQQANILMARGKKLQYVLWFNKACQLEPQQRDRLWKNLIDWLHAQKEYTGEKQVLREALKHHRQWDWAWDRLGALAADKEEKMAIYQDALKYNKAWGHAYYQLSLLSES